MFLSWLILLSHSKKDQTRQNKKAPYLQKNPFKPQDEGNHIKMKETESKQNWAPTNNIKIQQRGGYGYSAK